MTNKVVVAKKEEIPDPDVELLPISSKGEIKLRFNQDMIAPDHITQSTYRNVFVVSITSSLDGSTAYGRFANPKRDLQEGGEQTEAEKLQFTLQTVEHNARNITIQTNWADPSLVSALGDDQVKIDILEPSLFSSKLTFKPISRPRFQLEKTMPPLIVNEQQAAQLTSSAELGGTVVNSVTTGNFIASLFMQGSLQQMWGMIRSL